MVDRSGIISLHAVDVAAGHPARGMWVEIWQIAPERIKLGAGPVRNNGTFDATNAGIGSYEALFHIGAYFQDLGLTSEKPAFLDVAVFRFGIADSGVEYHLPLKFTPWGFSLFRGA